LFLVVNSDVDENEPFSAAGMFGNGVSREGRSRWQKESKRIQCI